MLYLVSCVIVVVVVRCNYITSSSKKVKNISNGEDSREYYSRNLQ